MLINNAGYALYGAITDIPTEELRHQFDTNVIAPVQVARAFLPFMLPQRRGRIVNIGSVSGVLTTPFAGAYCASKAAFHAVSDAMRLELAPFGIEVITIQPGAVTSNIGKPARTTWFFRPTPYSLPWRNASEPGPSYHNAPRCPPATLPGK